VCPEGTQDCNGDQRCESFGTDWHCSGCNDRCTGGRVCVTGACTCDGTCGDACPCPDGYLCRQHCSDGACHGECVCDPSQYCGTACECPDEQVCVRRECHADVTYCTTDGECPGGRICWDGVCLCDLEPWGRCGSDCPCHSFYGGTCQSGQCVCDGQWCFELYFGYDFCCTDGQVCQYDLTGTHAWCATL
jgi:hypothetical protein